MTDFMDIIKTRRSTRKYMEKDIPDELLAKVLESVQWSPSWANTQCWEIVVVKDRFIKEELQKIIGPKNPATKAIVAAPVLLVLCAKYGTSGFYNDKVTTKHNDWYMFDLGIAAQSISLTAHALGLGSVVVGLFDQDKANTILKVPEGYDSVALMPIGYPAKQSSPPKRKTIEEFTHYDHF